MVTSGGVKDTGASKGFLGIQTAEETGVSNIVWILDRFSSTASAEGFQTFQRSVDGAAYISSGTYLLTAGKRFVLDSATLVVHSSGTAFNAGAQSAYLRIRMNNANAPSLTDPVQWFAVASASGAQVGNSFEDFPKGMVYQGTGSRQIGFSLQVPTWSATANPVISAIIHAREY